MQSKCDEYWPTRGSALYGWIHVTLVDVIELATYTVRTFHLEKVGFILSFLVVSVLCLCLSLCDYAYADVSVSGTGVALLWLAGTCLCK